MNKLVVKELEIAEEFTTLYPVGYKYVYFVDPETGKYYEPAEGFTVTGEDLEKLFREVGSAGEVVAIK